MSQKCPINHAIIDMNTLDTLDFVFDPMPNLRILEINHSMLARQNLVELSKLRCMQRLDFLDSGERFDLDALCCMFSSLSRLWFLKISFGKESKWSRLIQTSEKLRNAMQNVTHIVAFMDISPFDPVSVVADAIETLAMIKTLGRVTITPYWNNEDIHLIEGSDSEDDYDGEQDFARQSAAAHAMACKLQSSRLFIDIFE
jgi:hypothetical protein